MYIVQTIQFEPQAISTRKENSNLNRLKPHSIKTTNWVARLPPGQEVVVAYGTFAPPLP